MPIRALIWVLLGGAIGFAENPEFGRVERQGSQATLIVDGLRPVSLAAITLAEEFGLRINVEDPGPGFPLVRRRLTVEFHLTPNGLPADVAGLIRRVVETANGSLPVHYRFDEAGGWYSIIPAQARDKNGRLLTVTPMMDRLVTIPAGRRPVAASADLMAKALARQTGAHIHCCQAFVGGIPWGLAEVEFSANAEPARQVLKRLVRAAEVARAAKDHWLLNCDAASPAWCFINLRHISR